MIAKILLIGCGDIAQRLAARLPAGHFSCSGLRRQPERLPTDISGIRWDLNSADTAGLAERIRGFDIMVFTPVPNSRDEAGYRQAYVENLQKIITALGEQPPRLLLLVSSSSVYGQEAGEWVDEDSATEPEGFRGRTILEGEKHLRDSGLPHCILRFSGIYGPGRERLLAQVKKGEWSEADNKYSNRIHSEDCAAVLAHLIEARLRGAPLQNLYLASDDEPVSLAEVKRWLAAGLGMEVPPDYAPGETKTGRRCSNRRLRESGFEFRFPSFREGYARMLSRR